MSYTPEQIMMTLSAISYATPETIGSYLSPDTSPQNATDGQWKLVWGPALTWLDKGNLMFACQNTSTGDYAVAIRGTYPRFSLAMLVDLYEDLDVSHPDAWQFPTVPGAMVAGGALDGLTDLVGLQANGVSFNSFAISMVASGQTIYVTGHSLGGALASVLAPWLKARIPAGTNTTVVPYTFAAPSAGNADFAAWYNEQFPTSQRYYNQLDVIPRAWAEIGSIKALFPAPGPSCPWELKGSIDLVEGWLDLIDVKYVQTNGPGVPLPGVAVNTGAFFAELLDQHDHNYYLKLLGAPAINVATAVAGG